MRFSKKWTMICGNVSQVLTRSIVTTVRNIEDTSFFWYLVRVMTDKTLKQKINIMSSFKQAVA